MDYLTVDGLHLAFNEADQVLALVHPGDGQCGDGGPGECSQVTITLYFCWKSEESAGQVLRQVSDGERE